MNKLFEEMSYKEFKHYCNERACDGKWTADEALMCIKIMREIDSIEVKVLGIRSTKQTKQAKENAWNKFKEKLSK